MHSIVFYDIQRSMCGTPHLLASRQALAAVRGRELEPCRCDPWTLVRVPGDVAMCPCGYWHVLLEHVGPTRVSPEVAAGFARQPMDNDAVLDAFARSAADLDALIV